MMSLPLQTDNTIQVQSFRIDMWDFLLASPFPIANSSLTVSRRRLRWYMTCRLVLKCFARLWENLLVRRGWTLYFQNAWAWVMVDKAWQEQMRTWIISCGGHENYLCQSLCATGFLEISTRRFFVLVRFDQRSRIKPDSLRCVSQKPKEQAYEKGFFFLFSALWIPQSNKRETNDS